MNVKSRDTILSIIIPNYNNGKYLTRCLTSILVNSSDEIEVIVVDDGSTDNSVDILNNIKDNRVSVFCKENEGVSVARNLGIKKSIGKYIIFCDSDDYYNDNAISYIVDYIKNLVIENDIIIFGAYVVKNELKIKWNNFFLADTFNINKMLIGLYRDGSFNSPWNKIYKKSIIENNGIEFPVGIRTSEDGIFNINYALFCNSIAVIDEILYCYCYRESDVSSVKINNIYIQLEQLKIKEKIRENLLKKIIAINILTVKEIKLIQSLHQYYATQVVYEYTKSMTKENFKIIRKYIKNDNKLLKLIKTTKLKKADFKIVIKALIVMVRIK